MAQPGELIDRYDLGTGTMPDITNAVYMVDYEHMPFMRKASRGKATNINPEWGIDDLRAAKKNAKIDGDDFSADSRNVVSRISNYCQISREDIAISGRADVVAKTGRKRETAYQLAKAAREVKRDMEHDLLSRSLPVEGSSSSSGVSAGVAGWLKTNFEGGSGSAAPTLSGGKVNSIGTAGTARALSFATFKKLMRRCHEQGGMPNEVFMAPELHDSFSAYLYGSAVPVASQRQDQGKGKSGGSTVIAYVSQIETPFGVKSINNDLYMPSGTTGGELYALDMDHWAILYLRPFQVLRIGKSGDSTRRIFLVDYTLCSKQEKGSGVIADLNTEIAVVA